MVNWSNHRSNVKFLSNNYDLEGKAEVKHKMPKKWSLLDQPVNKKFNKQVGKSMGLYRGNELQIYFS